jgi:Ca2+-binding RTX toxin-like protein
MPFYFYGTNYSETIGGTNSADVIYGYGGHDTLYGYNGNDRLYGGAGDDDLIGGNGINTLWGGSGRDWFVMTARSSLSSDDLIADFEFGYDKIDVAAWGVSDFSQIKAILTADGWGDARINAFAGGYNHIITVDQVSPGQLISSDFIYSNGGARNLVGTAYNDVMFGSRYADTLNGGSANDTLLGGIGNDRLLGSYGSDDLHGGAGYDVMTGGMGYDAFNFDAITDSVPGSWRDRITDFQEDVDFIDLSRIDANVFAAGNQAFQFIGTAAFYAAGQVNYYLSAGDTIISANTDNDAAAEFQIALNGYHQMIRADFVL